MAFPCILALFFCLSVSEAHHFSISVAHGPSIRFTGTFSIIKKHKLFFGTKKYLPTNSIANPNQQNSNCNVYIWFMTRIFFPKYPMLHSMQVGSTIYQHKQSLPSFVRSCWAEWLHLGEQKLKILNEVMSFKLSFCKILRMC